jgi:hypothetical protein
MIYFKILNCLSLVLVLLSIVSSGHAADPPTVRTEQGTLKGKYLTSRNGREYAAFLGIRYATVPERFEVREAF